jgi:hypothetical protein
MHDAQFEIDGEAVTVGFNSDWSGQALILIGDRNFILPAELFVRVAKLINERALDKILDRL